MTHLGGRFFDLSENGGFKEIVLSWDMSIRAFQINILLIVFLLSAEAVNGGRLLMKRSVLGVLIFVGRYMLHWDWPS